MSRVIPQIEAQKALISKIVMSRQIDHQTGSWNKFANKAVKMVIFVCIMEKWSRDPSFGSIYNADWWDSDLIPKFTKSFEFWKNSCTIVFGTKNGEINNFSNFFQMTSKLPEILKSVTMYDRITKRSFLTIFPPKSI